MLNERQMEGGVVVLAGGVGGSRFTLGVAQVAPPERVTVVSNTGDDETFFGLHVSPDPDIMTYALAGLVDEQRGWGLRGDTFRWLEAMGRLGHETWFQIGDLDLATHVHRTEMLRQGKRLSEVQEDIARRLGVRQRVLPMTDDRVRTVVRTAAGTLPFQRFLIERRTTDEVREVVYEGAESARPAAGVIEAIAAARAICIAPSNPISSIGPILAIPGVREAIKASKARVVAVSPIIGGTAFTPPAVRMMEGLGLEVSAVGVAECYRGVADALALHVTDANLAARVEALGMEAIVTNTIMSGPAEKRALAETVLRSAGW